MYEITVKFSHLVFKIIVEKKLFNAQSNILKCLFSLTNHYKLEQK